MKTFPAATHSKDRLFKKCCLFVELSNIRVRMFPLCLLSRGRGSLQVDSWDPAVGQFFPAFGEKKPRFTMRQQTGLSAECVRPAAEHDADRHKNNSDVVKKPTMEE